MLGQLFRSRSIFTGTDKIGKYQRNLSLTKHFSTTVASTSTDLLEDPIDDVYLKTLYESKTDSLPTAIERMKKYTKLDFIDQTSLVYLKLDLNADGRKKNKKINLFTTISLPHNFDHKNKVALITTDPDNIEVAENNGAHVAGSTSVFISLMTGKVTCDAFVCTADCEKQLATHVDMNRKFGRLLPSKSKRDITDDFLPILEKYSTQTLCHNAINHDESKIIVGRINQDSKEIASNITTAIQTVSEIKQGKKFVIGASISCMTEYIPFQYLNSNENL